MNRQAQAAVLVLLGVAVLRAGLTDIYLRYVKAGLRPLLIVVGVILIATAVATIWYEWRPARSNRSHDSGHGHREPLISWLLVLPFFALVLVAPPALGSYTADRTGTALQPPPGFTDLPAGDPLKLSVVDYATRAVYDHGRSLGDRRVAITGFVTVGRDGTFYLTRMVLNCCAADAQPVKVGLSGQVPPALRPDAWIEAVGTYTGKRARDPINGGPIPFINASQVRPVRAPRDSYEA